MSFLRSKRINSDMISKLSFSSKETIKREALLLANGNIEYAKKIYDFLIDGLNEIPDIDPTQKPFLDNLKEQSSEIFGWLRENEDVLTKGAEFIKGLFSKKAPAQPLPPINQ